MEPPWIKHPDIPLGSIGWRMGYGEDYWLAFSNWYKQLGTTEKAAFRTQHPEPAEVEHGYPWTGFYDRLEK
jgi:hypothetical protein